METRQAVTLDGQAQQRLWVLRDGTACGQAEALVRVARDPGLLYPSESAAARDGLTRLRQTGARRRRTGRA